MACIFRSFVRKILFDLNQGFFRCNHLIPDQLAQVLNLREVYSSTFLRLFVPFFARSSWLTILSALVVLKIDTLKIEVFVEEKILVLKAFTCIFCNLLTLIVVHKHRIYWCPRSVLQLPVMGVIVTSRIVVTACGLLFLRSILIQVVPLNFIQRFPIGQKSREVTDFFFELSNGDVSLLDHFLEHAILYFSLLVVFLFELFQIILALILGFVNFVFQNFNFVNEFVLLLFYVFYVSLCMMDVILLFYDQFFEEFHFFLKLSFGKSRFQQLFFEISGSIFIVLHS